MRCSRSAYVHVRLADAPSLDITALLSGAVKIEDRPALIAYSALSMTSGPLELDHLKLMLTLPESWVDVPDDAAAAAALLELAERGLVLIDRDEAPFDHFRERDRLYTDTGFPPGAALYHCFTEDRTTYPEAADFETAVQDAAEYFQDLASKNGEPPPALFTPPQAQSVLELPSLPSSGALADILKKRRTTRSFSDEPLALDQLSRILQPVWGCQGTSQISDSLTALRKTSPSGGCLHPIECYPLILNVDGLEPGQYHYSPTHHLSLLRAMDRAEARDLARRAGHGQLYLPDAAVVLWMVSRFERHFWKYRMANRGYTVMLMDAAFLAQTFYLVCAEMGLGACFTAALDANVMEEALDLDGITQGPVGMCGCGHPSDQPSFDLPIVPFTAQATPSTSLSIAA